jgi:hypothetical protein
VNIPFRERLWCRPGEAGQFIGRGKTWIFDKIRSGEIVSKLDGRRTRLIHVPSLIARYGLTEDQVGSGEIIQPAPESGVGSNCQAVVPAAREDKTLIKRQKSDNVNT